MLRFRIAIFIAGILICGLPDSTHGQGRRGLGETSLIYVGTYAEEGSKGIYLFQMKTSDDPDIPEFVTVVPLGVAAETPNPSYLQADAKRRVLFCVNEIDSFDGAESGAVSSFAIDPASGKLSPLSQRPSMGIGPSYFAVDRSGGHLVVANHKGGSVAVLPIGPDGRLGEATDVRQHEGRSVHPGRQAAPHPHGLAFSPDNQFLFVCDLGLDKVMQYRFDAQSGRLTPHEPAFTALSPGAGPRHIVFRPDGRFAYVSNELDSTVTVFAYDTNLGTLIQRETVPTVPGYYDGPNAAGELAVHPAGKHLYVSNHGHNSIVLFNIESGGTLSYVEDQSTYGLKPRTFGLDADAKHVAVPNQDSNGLLILRVVNAATGRVKPGGNLVETPSPTSAIYLPPMR